MNRLSSDSLARDAGAAVRTPIAARRMLIWTAWISTLLLSKLPLVIARDLLGSDIPWINLAWIGTAGLLIAATFLWPVIRPLRVYFLIMAVILLMVFGVEPFIMQTAAWANLLAGQAEIVTVFAGRVLLSVETLVVISCLFLMGIKRPEAFLAVGNMQAPVGEKVPSGKRRVLTWSVLGPAMAILLGGLFFTFLVSQIPAGLSNLAAVIPWAPLILLSAALNAFGEEAMYRAAPLATLSPAVGPRHALWLTSLWFGLGHYYGGIPSGPAGLVGTGLLALLLGKAMLDTRGMGLPWFIHLVIDLTIYTFLVLSIV